MDDFRYHEASDITRLFFLCMGVAPPDITRLVACTYNLHQGICKGEQRAQKSSNKENGHDANEASVKGYIDSDNVPLFYIAKRARYEPLWLLLTRHNDSLHLCPIGGAPGCNGCGA